MDAGIARGQITEVMTALNGSKIIASKAMSLITRVITKDLVAGVGSMISFGDWHVEDIATIDPNDPDTFDYTYNSVEPQPVTPYKLGL